MTGSLRDLGERVGAVPAPRLDVSALVAAGESRLRRRRATAVTLVTTVVVLVLAAAALLAPGSRQADAPPADGNRTHSPDEDTVETRPAARLLTYAVGPVIHWGDRTVDVRDQIPGRDRQWPGFLAATDDGVVFASGPPLRHGGVAYDEPVPVWFTDGSTPVRIGTTSGSGVRGYLIAQPATGSTVAWREDYYRGVVVVYDTGRMREVARFGGRQSYVLNEVYDDVVYWTPDGEACTTNDTRTGSLVWCGPSARVMRFDVASQRQSQVSWADYVADRRGRPGILTGRDREVPDCVSCFVSPDGLYPSVDFVRQGRRLVLGLDFGLDFRKVSPGESLTVARTGEPVRLRLPPRYEDAERWVLTQWLDADTVVLWADGEPAGRTDRGKTDELLVCRLSTGGCRIAGASDRVDGLFTPPGPAGIKG